MCDYAGSMRIPHVVDVLQAVEGTSNERGTHPFGVLAYAMHVCPRRPFAVIRTPREPGESQLVRPE